MRNITVAVRTDQYFHSVVRRIRLLSQADPRVARDRSGSTLGKSGFESTRIDSCVVFTDTMEAYRKVVRDIEKERTNFLSKIDLVQPSFEEQHQLEVCRLDSHDH